MCGTALFSAILTLSVPAFSDEPADPADPPQASVPAPAPPTPAPAPKPAPAPSGAQIKVNDTVNFKFAQVGKNRFGLRQDPAGGPGHQGTYIPWFDAPEWLVHGVAADLVYADDALGDDDASADD